MFSASIKCASPQLGHQNKQVSSLNLVTSSIYLAINIQGLLPHETKSLAALQWLNKLMTVAKNPRSVETQVHCFAGCFVLAQVQIVMNRDTMNLVVSMPLLMTADYKSW